jgi:hypothetical protein
MASKHDTVMLLTDGREVLVDYVVESYGSDPSGEYGPPENYDPGSGPELYIEKIVLLDGPDEPIEIAPEERERLEATIIENPDWWMPSDDDYDWEF